MTRSALVINFFPAFVPPSSGGELRVRNLYRALAATHQVTLLTATDFAAQPEKIVHSDGFSELRFPKDQLWRDAYATLERSGLSGDLSGLAFALAVSDPACRLRQAAQSLAASADVVIHEFPYSEPIFADHAVGFEIYNSHNFEASLLPCVVHGSGLETAMAKLMRLEANLTARAKLVLATSADDAEKFRLFYGVPAERLACCPNGYDEAALGPIAARRGKRPGARPRLLFTGSAHTPNAEAAAFLIDMAPLLPQCDVIIAGGVCTTLTGSALPENVIAFGAFDEAQKHALLETADLFLNPVTSGSGTSLKALEALGAGLPMVSTPEGVRGLDIAPDVHAVVVPRADFVAAVAQLVRDHRRRKGLAARGLALARSTYTWNIVAQGLQARLGAPIPAASPGRPLALALNDYPVSAATSGGMARVCNLLSRLDHDVVLVSFGSAFAFTLSASGLLHVTVPKTAAHIAFEHAANRGQALSLNDGVASLFAGTNAAMTAVVCAVARRSAAVIFEHCYMAPLLDAIQALRPDIPVIYSAHNVEATHKAALLRQHSAGATFIAFIAELERRLVARSDLVVCCTQADAQHFAASGVETVVAPNGCGIPEDRLLIRAAGMRAGRVGFLGSGHHPNVAAAEFILRVIAPAFPDVEFELVGGVCSAIAAPLPPNVRLLGVVDEAAKTRILASWDVALNPVESGGGSSLKLPDFMAHGLATINTPAGARGFAVAEHDAGAVVELRQFGDSLTRLLGDPDRLAAQRANARRYASACLSWEAATEPYRTRLRRLSAVPHLAPARRSSLLQTPKHRSLLIVTYRYTEPPLGGAEEYLIEVLKWLRPRFDRIDLAATGIGHLTNHHHFGTTFSTQGAGATHIIGDVFDRVRFFAPDAVPEARAMTLARNLERAWAQEEQELYLPFLGHLGAAGEPRLVSGFFGLASPGENRGGNHAESPGEATRRWTFPSFSFLLPAAASAVRLRGWVPHQKTLRLMLLEVNNDGGCTFLMGHAQTISARFDVGFALPSRGDAPALLVCDTDEHQVPADQRPFGVRLQRVAVLLGAADGPATETAVDLSEEHGSRWRAEHFDLWVDTLLGLARRRGAATEADFAELRGPHSAALQTWLAEHGSEYDTVLVQGVPFDVIPSSVKTLRGLQEPPRIVTLPHFHGDDRFYYWRRYLESFEAADTTLLFSSAIAGRLGPRDRFAVVPGGGIRPDEFADIGAAGRFRRVLGTQAPYFLVLGRKTASKGYQQVLRAHDVLRNAGNKVDLVLIGPDEDGAAVQGQGVHQLAQQPRDIVRGALSACLGLINMSSSESFGIVICEAWLFGKPVIANRACHAFRELVRDGETGLLVDGDRELRDAMERLAKDASLRARMGQAGFAEAVQRYTWPKVAEGILDALEGRTSGCEASPLSAQPGAAPRQRKRASAAGPTRRRSDKSVGAGRH